jgi:hypothetical protein
MTNLEQQGSLSKVVDWFTSRLPSRETVAMTAVLGAGWGFELAAKSERAELGAFGANAKSTVVHNSGWDARLNEVALTVTERGAYRAEIRIDGVTVQTQQFSVAEEPAFVQFQNVEPRGGLGGVITPGGSPFNFGYGYGNHSYEIKVTKELTDAPPVIATAKL